MDPYIGITGFTGSEEVAGALRIFPPAGKRKLMVGVLATYKSLRGIPMKEKWAKQTPKSEDVAHIFLPDSYALNLVHLSTEEDQKETLLADMIRINEVAGPFLHGFQLNVAWPQMNQLYTYRATLGQHHKIVLQIGQKAVEQAGGTAEGVVKHLELYKENIDAILLDPSGGKGRPFDPERAYELLTAIQEQGWDLALGVAGGLGPQSFHLVKNLVGDFPDLNIDAQGKLRNQDNELDQEMVKTYLRKAFTIFS